MLHRTGLILMPADEVDALASQSIPTQQDVSAEEVVVELLFV